MRRNKRIPLAVRRISCLYYCRYYSPAQHVCKCHGHISFGDHDWCESYDGIRKDTKGQKLW